MKKQKKKKMSALLILGVGLIVSLIIIYSGSNPNKEQSALLAFSDKYGGTFFDFETLKERSLGERIKPSGENITENVIWRFQQEIAELNHGLSPEQAQRGQIAMPQEERLLEMINEEIIKGLDLKEKKASDIKIVPEESANLNYEYLKALYDGIAEHLENFEEFHSALAKTINENNDTELMFHLTASGDFIEHLLLMEVPKNWAVFHLDFLNLMEKRKLIANSLINRAHDFVRAAGTASIFLEELIREEEKIYLNLLKFSASN